MEIRIYVEGDTQKTGKNSSISLREGFHHFLTELIERARERKIKFRIVTCGSKFLTFKDFLSGVKVHKNSFVSFLIDSDEAISDAESVKAFLERQNSSWHLISVRDEQCHVMVQVMESWFLADRDALSEYYGQGFRIAVIPQNPRTEEIPKTDIIRGLENATRNTSKGVYHKTRHGSELLSRIDPQKVRQASPHCNRLFDTISEVIAHPETNS